MSKFEEQFEIYKAENKKLKLGLDESFIEKVAKGLGPSIYNADSSTVAGSDKKELETVRKNFLIKKLGLEKGPYLDGAIGLCMEAMGKSNPRKHRALVYGWLCVHFAKESVYE